MTYETLLALSGFAFVSSITPGPNNLMVLASGANFGLRRAVPHILGIGIGFVAMIVIVGLGLAGLFVRFPVAHSVLSVISVVYLVWLAWKIANAAPPEDGQSQGQPITFVQAALFQWVNPKAWAMALTAVTLYAGAGSPVGVAMVAAVFGAITFPCVVLWCVLGQKMRLFLTNASRLRVFNYTMAVLLILSVVPMLFH